MTSVRQKGLQVRVALVPIIAWSVFIALLAGSTLYMYHHDMLKEAENEARDYFRLNMAYRSWAARLGGVYASRDRVEPNPYLKVPHRDINTTRGPLTLINPAYMTRMVFETIQSSSSSPVLNKLTSLKPLNPKNAPDPWEQEALREFEAGSYSERSEVASINGKPYLRFISAFITEKPCLTCHASQGYREGDVRGGITISIPMEGYYLSESKTRKGLLTGYLLLWLVGSGGITASAKRRREYELELQAGEDKFRTVCDWTQDWEYWVDQEGFFKYISPSCVDVTGYAPEDFLNDRNLLSRLLHPDDMVQFELHHAEGALGSPPASTEFRILTKAGSVRWIHHTCRPVFGDGKFLGRRVSNRDVTDRKLAEQILLRSERFNVSLNRISQAFLTSSSEQQMYQELLVALLEVMESPGGMVGYLDERGDLVCAAASLDENQAEQTSLVFPAARWGDTLWGVALRSGEARYANAPQPLPDGHRQVERCLAVPLVSRGRSIALLMVINRECDYTDLDLDMLQSIGKQVAPVLKARLDQQKAAAQLRENENKLQVIFDVVQAGIVQIDSGGAITFANQRMAEMFGVTMDELLGSAYSSHVAPEERAVAENGLRKLLNGELESTQYERHYLRRDGSLFWGYLIARRFSGPDGREAKLVATITDMTELKSAEEKRHKTEQQMLHVQKLESLGVLAGGIAHDFNNILLAIMGNTSLALHRAEPGSPVERHLQQIEKASEKAADLARQMLAYSGKGRFVLEALNLNQLVREMTSMLEVSLSKKASLHFHPAPNLPGILADPTQIRQVIMNLAINASEAIGDNSGVISISTGSRDCDSSYLAESWLNEELPEGHYVYLEVSDNGCGMNKETVDRIFEPFFTTKFTGRGLGMAAILGIVRGHKGVIKVYSEPGKGSNFKIFFPATERPVQISSGGDAHAAWRGEGTVLLVDDEETVRGVAGAMLEELGFDVIQAVDGRDALDQYQLHRDRIKLVLMDLNMPNLNGEEAFHELRRIDAQARVILSSGFSEQEVTRKFLGKGLEGFVQKPYTLATLRNVVSRI